jgi:hypothetical protein
MLFAIADAAHQRCVSTEQESSYANFPSGRMSDGAALDHVVHLGKSQLAG